MKIKEIICETPYLDDEDLPEWVDPELANIRLLSREYSHMGRINDKAGDEYDCWLQNNGSSVISTKSDTTDVPVGFVRIAARLDLQPLLLLDIKNGIQEAYVQTDSAFRQVNIGSQMYKLLSRLGYTIVSDFVHHVGTREMWKKLAIDSSSKDYVIRVWSEELQDYYRDEAGAPIQYDGVNISEQDIWIRINERDGTTLLVMSKK